jgi:hypothetical protein
MSFSRRALVVVAALAVAGCASSPVFNFKKADNSGVDSGQLAMVLLHKGVNAKPSSQTLDADVAALVLADVGFQQASKLECGYEPPPAQIKGVAPALVPLIAAVGQLFFNLYVDGLVKRAEELKAAAQPSPGVVRLAVMGTDFNGASCVLFVRYVTDPAPRLGLAVILKLVSVPANTPLRKALVLRPVYVRAQDSVAVTAPSKTGGNAKIAVVAALSVKEVGISTNRIPGVFAGSEGAVRIPDVEIGDKAPARCSSPPRCVDSDILAFPEAANIVSISMSVAEVGDVGFDIDLAMAELKAIKEAIGPAIDTSINTWLGPK